MNLTNNRRKTILFFFYFPSQEYSLHYPLLRIFTTYHHIAAILDPLQATIPQYFKDKDEHFEHNIKQEIQNRVGKITGNRHAKHTETVGMEIFIGSFLRGLRQYI